MSSPDCPGVIRSLSLSFSLSRRAKSATRRSIAYLTNVTRSLQNFHLSNNEEDAAVVPQSVSQEGNAPKTQSLLYSKHNEPPLLLLSQKLEQETIDSNTFNTERRAGHHLLRGMSMFLGPLINFTHSLLLYGAVASSLSFNNSWYIHQMFPPMFLEIECNGCCGTIPPRSA